MGPDHATEVDPFSAGSISVIRGMPAHGMADAIGGVILVEPPPSSHAWSGGKFLTAFNSNGQQPMQHLGSTRG